MADIRKLERHLAALRQKHSALETQLNTARRHHGAAADDEVKRIKKEKLQLKDEIAECERELKQLKAAACRPRLVHEGVPTTAATTSVDAAPEGSARRVATG